MEPISSWRWMGSNDFPFQLGDFYGFHVKGLRGVQIDLATPNPLNLARPKLGFLEKSGGWALKDPMSILLKRISLNILPVLSSLHLPCLGESSNKFQAPWFKLGTNISPPKACLKMMFLFPRWDMFSSLEGIYIYNLVHLLGGPSKWIFVTPPWSLGTFHVKNARIKSTSDPKEWEPNHLQDGYRKGKQHDSQPVS